MTDDTETNAPSPRADGKKAGAKKADAKAEREARLAAALRANLRRRKDRARAAAQPDMEGGGVEEGDESQG